MGWGGEVSNERWGCGRTQGVGQARHGRWARTPHCEMTMGNLGLLFAPTATFSILRTVSMPSMTCGRSRAVGDGEWQKRAEEHGIATCPPAVIEAPPNPNPNPDPDPDPDPDPNPNHLAEDDVLVVQPVACVASEEKLAAIRVGTW